MSSKTRQQLEEWIRTKTVNGKVIDIGGSQKPVFGRINVAGETEFFVLDLENPHELDTKPQIIWDMNDPDIHNFPRQDLLGSFDFAVCLEVAEYWWNPLVALNNLCKFLKRDGTLFVSFHFLYPIHKPADQDYLRYTPKGAEKLLSQAGFQVIKHDARMMTTDGIIRGFAAEGMKPAPLVNHYQIGSLIEARKK